MVLGCFRIRSRQRLNEAEREMLRLFQCPYQEEEGQCRSFRCLFGHIKNYQQAEDIESREQLKSLPVYVCLASLLGKCKATLGVDNLACSVGVHVPILELETFELVNNEAYKLAIAKWFDGRLEDECDICFDRVMFRRLASRRFFGVMENCDHTEVQCAECLMKHRTRRHTPECAFDRNPSDRVIFLAHPRVRNADAKRELFKNVEPDLIAQNHLVVTVRRWWRRLKARVVLPKPFGFGKSIYPFRTAVLDVLVIYLAYKELAKRYEGRKKLTCFMLAFLIGQMIVASLPKEFILTPNNAAFVRCLVLGLVIRLPEM